MTPEQERKAKDAARKREAYRRRKEAQAELSNKSIIPSLHQEAALRIAKANGINVQPTPEAEEAWKQQDTYRGNIPPLSKEQLAEYVSNLEKAEAVISESVAREEYVDMLFAKYAKTTNIPQLLQGIIREQITLRVTLTDLIGGLRK